MATLNLIICLTLMVGGAATTSAHKKYDTPVSQVIELIGGLLNKSKMVAAAEGKTYDEFACFCKDTNAKKSDSIETLSDNIEMFSSDIEKKTAEKAMKETELTETKAKKEGNMKTLKKTETEHAAAKAAYEVEEADLSKAISDLEMAKQSLEDAKTPPAASLLETFAETLRMADAMGMVSPKQQKVVASLLQHKAGVDPDKPNYAYHSQGIIDVIDNLHAEFTTKKATLDADWKKADANFNALEKDLKDAIAENTKMIGELTIDISKLTQDIAKAKEDLIDAEAQLKDDKLYMHDLTERCELRANEFDQRSAMYGSEQTTLEKAISILTEKVEPTDQEANARAFTTRKEEAASLAQEGSSSLSFLQAVPVKNHHSQSFLIQRGQVALSSEAKKQRALAKLALQGELLHSKALSSLAARATKDPFFKVKELIQKLIERLVEEAEGEATKKGFCDTELGKKNKDRDFRMEDVMSLNAEIAQLEAKRDEFEVNIGEYTKNLKDTDDALKEATKLRAEDKANNLNVLELGEEGYKAVKECIDLLKTFYRKAARVFLQVSPLDEDTKGAGFDGYYKGQQVGMRSVIGLLEVIKSDYERTIKRTTQEEADAHAKFNKFDRSSKADLSGKSKGKELDVNDLATTKATIESKMADLQTQMDLLDAANKELVNLNPMCVDSGMSYKERVTKREAEIKALKTALCQLDTDEVEESCDHSS